VRASQEVDEEEALRSRYAAAIREARRRGCRRAVLNFGKSVEQSKAVIGRSPSIAKSLMESDNALYVNYYSGVEAGVFMPRDNDWDRHRESVDNEFFPHYFKEINFAALTLNDQGATGYGVVSLVLKTPMIGDRSSVFEENTMKFFMTRRIAIGDVIPKGYRSSWDNRALLAVAKLAVQINETTTISEYPGILLERSSRTDSDIIEIHVYGRIHRKTIEKVVVDSKGLKGARREDRIIATSIADSCRTVGAQYEVR
jgi:hypothetical protein